jgi:C4-dicarboxylate transporter DctQ subunit
MINTLEKIDRFFEKLETGVITSLLFALIGVGLIQIFLRRFTDMAIPDLEISMRWVVVWITFLGASIATRQRKHISVDALGRLFTGSNRHILDILIDLLSLFVVSVIILAAYEFWLSEMAFGDTLMNGIPSWYITLIFPLGYLLIALRLVLQIVFHFSALLTRQGDR